MEYLPFGETLVEEHLNSYNSPYKFNAKELDEETGWYYYGARYYNPKWSIWLSVDPASEIYPSVSPYVFVKNNPLNHLEIEGRFWIRITNGKAVAFATDYRWADSMDGLTAIPVLGMAFEFAKAVVMSQDPSYNMAKEDYASLALTIFNTGFLKFVKKAGKIDDLGQIILGLDAQMKESLYDVLSNPDRAELGVEYLTFKSLEKEGFGTMTEDKEGKSMNTIFSFDQDYVDEMAKEIKQKNGSLSQKEQDKLLEQKLNNVIQNKKDHIRKNLSKDE